MTLPALLRRAAPAALGLLAACDAPPEPPDAAAPSPPAAERDAPDPTPVRPVSGEGEASPRHQPPDGHVMGIGEAPDPQPFTLEQRFLDAVRRGDRAEVERALELGASVHAADDLGRNALLLAARDAGSLPLVRFLHERGARPDQPDVAGRTPTSFAAGRGRPEIVRYLVEHGAAPDRADEQGRTPLFHAVAGDHRETARYLIEQGADVNVRDRFQDTPLMLACAKAHGEMAALLLEHGADPSLEDQEGRTARERAAPGVTVCRKLGAA